MSSLRTSESMFAVAMAVLALVNSDARGGPTVSLVPVDASGDHVIVGHEIILIAGAGTAEPNSNRAPNAFRTLIPQEWITYLEYRGPERVIYNDESLRAGSAADATVQNLVFKNDFDSGLAVFFNYLPNKGLLFPGTVMADEAILGNGFDTARDFITGFEIEIYRSELDPTIGQTLATYHVELWDGDPFGEIESSQQGVIASATFSNLPGPGRLHAPRGHREDDGGRPHGLDRPLRRRHLPDRLASIRPVAGHRRHLPGGKRPGGRPGGLRRDGNARR